MRSMFWPVYQRCFLHIGLCFALLSHTSLALPQTTKVFNISHIHDLRKVTVATCSSSANRIDINPPTYSGTQALGYFDLTTPGSQTLNSDYSIRGNPPAAGAVGTLYGREHVYELQMLSLFIDFLATNQHDLWISPTFPSFCTWANTYLKAPYFPQGGGNGQSVIVSLQRCLPANSFRGTDLPTPQGNQMVWLENIANGAKASAIAGEPFRSQASFDDYEPVKQVAVFRAAAGVMSYLNSGIAFQQFAMTHDCVNAVWVNWFNRYKNDPNLPAGLDLDNIDLDDTFENLYTEWIDDLLLDIHTNIVGFLQDMTDWFDGPQQNVPLDFAGNLRTANAQGVVQVQVTQADLQAETNRVSNLPISWRVLL